jgi:hypothetical protein
MKVRQPLGVVALSGVALDVPYTDLITDELNVLEVCTVDDMKTLSGTWVQRETAKLCVALCTDLTDELRSKAMVRELVRAINQIRKEKGYTREDRITIVYSTMSELVQATMNESRDELMHSVLADDISVGDAETEVELNGEVISLRVALSS